MEINVGIIVSILIGILFVILGNYMPKLQQNFTVGIRVPWTLNSTENWNRTHRLGGKMFECRQCIRSGYSKEGYKFRIHLTEKESAGRYVLLAHTFSLGRNVTVHKSAEDAL